MAMKPRAMTKKKTPMRGGGMGTKKKPMLRGGGMPKTKMMRGGMTKKKK